MENCSPVTASRQEKFFGFLSAKTLEPFLGEVLLADKVLPITIPISLVTLVP